MVASLHLRSGTGVAPLVLEYRKKVERPFSTRAHAQMKKNYVLDTNVLLHDPHAIFKFDDNDVIIPIYVIEEVDQFKRESTERGRNARHVARLLDELRERADRSPQGVLARHAGARSQIAIPAKRPELATALDQSAQDQAILQTAIDVRDANGTPTVFVTMDTNLRIRADALGMPPRPTRTSASRSSSSTPASSKSTSTARTSTRSSRTATLRRPRVASSTPTSACSCAIASRRATRALGRYDAHEGAHRSAPRPARRRDGHPAAQQRADLRARPPARRLDPAGHAGRQGRHRQDAPRARRGPQAHGRGQAYTRLLVSRPVMPLGRDIGFLPGDVDEKLNPWMQPIFDNLEFLFSTGSGKGREPRGFAELLESGQIQVEPLTYIRGRSLPHQYLIVDEAQNLTPHEVKTIITRCGEGTKIVLTGDPFQIDNPYVDSASNGLTIVADRFSGEKLAGHIVLSKGERSELAEIAANLL